MRFWFDADNGPHVLILRPLAQELVRRGHRVVFTARDRAKTCELLQLYGLPYRQVGGRYGRGRMGKIVGTLGRAVGLAASMRRQRPDVSFGHGSRALPIASRLLGVPSVTMYDYEWVDPRLFNRFCDLILLPAAVDPERCREAGIAVAKVRHFDGFKEQLYLGGHQIEQGIPAELGLRMDAVKVLLRPPATTAHYHNPLSEQILSAVLEHLARFESIQLVYLPRTPDQVALPDRFGVREVIIPERVFDGPSLVQTVDLVIGGGGTMTREAALMGIPSYTFFQGRRGRVDEVLAQRGLLCFLDHVDDVRAQLALVRRNGPPSIPSTRPLVEYICECLEDAGRKATRH